ncbi:hypothetical protein [Mycobacterium botniense]|uniref:hypothetical protein n=1 Tax=Mycobacterium botniense TaxID=84962 RepID=UPI0013D750B8|nr:hypothetical protein [Mycobacterium botniense]
MTGMIVLAVAIVTGSTVIALVVIGLAMLGLLLLARDWWKHRGSGEALSPTSFRRDGHQPEGEVAHEDRALNPDMFEPDVLYDEILGNISDEEGFDVESEGGAET